MSLPSHLPLILFFSIFLLSSTQFSSESIEADKQALLAFKSQLNLDDPNYLSSWQTNSPSPCNWTCISCNSTRVVSINLSNSGLSGPLSPHIGNLSFLTSLQLQNNQLSGKIPDNIANLFRLTLLNLSSNSLQGSFPPNINNMSNLEILDLSMNRFTGKIPETLTSLRNLRVLNLGRNNLLGSIPPSVGNLSSLETLILGTNFLSGAIPGDLSRLQRLKVLDLTINELRGTVPSLIYNMSSLVDLALASNQLWGEIPSDIDVTLPNLLIINLCFNMFSGRIPGSLHNITNIRVIRMASNFLEGSVPAGLENLRFLEMYNIGFNKIVSYGDNGLDFITSLTNSTRLKFLAIDGNLLEGVIPESIGNLSNNLNKLYMGGNRIYGRIPASIGNLRSLSLLNVSYNSLTGPIPGQIGQLVNLQELNLAGNLISGRIPDSLGNLKKLNLIDLSKNELSGHIPISFGNFSDLLSMDLSANKLNGSIPKETLNLPSLSTILNLSNNFLTGNLIDEIGLLESVVTIDLANNLLSGNIPSSISSCTSLEKLYLLRNSFSGPIPDTLGDMRGLEILDLSSNNLSGPVPDNLEKLQAIQSLNVSFNNLEGEVPCSGLFTNLSRIEFKGNPKLVSVCSQNEGDGKKPVKVYIIISVIVMFVLLCFVSWYFFFSWSKKSKVGHSSSSLKDQHQIVSYQELRQATGNFDEINLAGRGSFGKVYKGLLGDSSLVAVKVFDIQQTRSLKSFAAECEALKNIRHRNLVKLITSCSSVDFRNVEFYALVYEFLVNGSLEDWIRGKRRKENGDGLNLMERLNVAIDVAAAVDYLHNDSENPVVHCDLKPSNILLNEDMTAKVGDFGLARLIFETANDQISSTSVLKGTTGFIPPEYGQGMKPSTAGDVYSFGVTLLELFTGKNPTDDVFKGENNLVRWVQSAYASKIMQVLDPELVLLMRHSSDHKSGNSEGPENEYECVMAVVGVGLCCCAESADGRITIRNALLKLQGARDQLVRNLKY